MNATFRHDIEPSTDLSMKGPVIASGLFHLFIFILTMISIPFIAKDPVVVTPVSIELVQVDEKTQTDIQSPPKEKPKEIEAPKPPESKPTPPQMYNGL